jgi:hypothetical protein
MAKAIKDNWFFWQDAFDILKEHGDGSDEDLALGNKISAAKQQAHPGQIMAADIDRLSNTFVEIVLTDEEISLLLDASKGAATHAEEEAANSLCGVARR